jgi:hypothetical protein
MSRILNARALVLLTCGYSLAVSVGLFGVALRLDERVIAGWAAVAASFYLAVILGSPSILETRTRRWWFAMAALINIGICAFGELVGFIIYGPALLVFVGMFVAPYGLARRYKGAADRRQSHRLSA